MKAIFTVMFLTVAASAAPVTIKIHSMTVTPPSGFTAGVTTTGAMNKETTPYTDFAGAGFSTSLIRGGVPDGEGADFFWASLTNAKEFPGLIRVSFTGDLTIQGITVPITFGGSLAWSAQGLKWHDVPPAFTVQASNGALIGVSFVTNLPGLSRGAHVTSSVDAQIKAQVLPNADVPEPLTLSTLGIGLAMMARRFRRK